MHPTDVIDGCELYRGDSLPLLLAFDADTFDAVITDPPYSSGGMTRGDRTQSTATKYVQTGTERFRDADFAGDNRDQRSWEYWCQLWLSQCLRITKPGGYCLMFTDWRQLPAATNAFQGGGWVWRGIVSWDKGLGARAPHKGYFRHQCEYLVWGTRGPCEVPPNDDPRDGPWAGSFSVTVRQDDKHHMTGKPTKLMRELVKVAPPGGRILDPFMGSGSTVKAAIQEGRQSVGIEVDATHYATALRRLTHATGTGKDQLFSFAGES